ncbi:DNA invertase Pin-like site-specific DNA recombinase [Bradyrhizobium sp. USDA 4532]|nr:DNA invertase Pin-like site-specific DNA recombinase [Bradyrhizobium sp. USDA 4545]MCP1920286.1 DNA invertase Pin-like site-specific DNA recombinase [Bradyrhizobium sp. USDA 4532]
MNELSKITAEHLRRCAIVYVRQSSTTQVEHNREATGRQYELAERAARLGWRRDQVKVLDEDLGASGSGLSERTGFARMAAEVGLGQVGIVLGLEVLRLARNNADWYRLLDLCGLTHTLIGDGDGIYHPGLFNDRLVLGLKGTMSEAELHVLHVLRARLLGGIRNKAARGELHRGLPVGLVRGVADGRCCCILTSRCKPRSMLSSTALPNSARHDACGCSAARKACAFRCTPTALSISAGSPPLTQRSTESSPTRSMPAFMCMAAPSRHAISMRAVESGSASDNATASSGRCSFVTIMPDTSIGIPSRRSRSAWLRTSVLDRTRAGVP